MFTFASEDAYLFLNLPYAFAFARPPQYAPNFDAFTIRTASSPPAKRDFLSLSSPGGSFEFDQNACVFDPMSPELVHDDFDPMSPDLVQDDFDRDATLTAAATLPDSDATFIAEPVDSDEEDPTRDEEEEYLRGAMDGDTARAIVEAVKAHMEEDELSQSARYSDLNTLDELAEESEPDDD